MVNILSKLFLLASVSVFVIFSISTGSNQEAHATTTTLNSVSCIAFSGTWNSLTATCTISTDVGTINPGDELSIPSGTTLVISNSAGYGLTNGGTITNSGTIAISNTGTYSAGIFNAGNIVNNPGGTITISNSGSSSIGIENGAGLFTSYTNITNSGTITISNTGTYSSGIFNDFGEIDNLSGGQITVSNTAGYGIDQGVSEFSTGTINNSGTINNYGTIRFTSSYFQNYINNTGTINDYCKSTFTIQGVFTGNPIVNACDSTTTTITPNPSNAPLGLTISFSGRVADTNTGTKTVPTGIISWSDGGKGGTFRVGSTVTNTCNVSQVNSSAGSCNMSYTNNPSTPIGTIITINGTYSGDATHQTSSGTSPLKVQRGTSTIISAGVPSVAHGAKKLLTVLVNDTSSGTKTPPTRTVSWMASIPGGNFTSNFCTLVPNSPSQSYCSVTYTAPATAGSVTITGSYNGDSTHMRSAGTSKLTVT